MESNMTIKVTTVKIKFSSSLYCLTTQQYTV